MFDTSLKRNPLLSCGLGAALVTAVIFAVPYAWNALAQFFIPSFSLADRIYNAAVALQEKVAEVVLYPAQLVLAIPGGGWFALFLFIMSFCVIFKEQRSAFPFQAYALLFIWAVIPQMAQVGAIADAKQGSSAEFSQWLHGQKTGRTGSYTDEVSSSGDVSRAQGKELCELRRSLSLADSSHYRLTINGKPAATTQCGLVNRMRWTPVVP